MVQFLSINFFSWISSIFVGFFKSSRFFCVTLYNTITQTNYNTMSIFTTLFQYLKIHNNLTENCQRYVLPKHVYIRIKCQLTLTVSMPLEPISVHEMTSTAPDWNKFNFPVRTTSGIFPFKFTHFTPFSFRNIDIQSHVDDLLLQQIISPIIMPWNTQNILKKFVSLVWASQSQELNTLRSGDADLRF